MERAREGGIVTRWRISELKSMEDIISENEMVFR